MLHTALIKILTRFTPPVFCITLITGLSYITSVVRENEELSTWFCYFIPAQLLGNWFQFLNHRSFVPISVDNYPGYVHTNRVVWYKSDDYYKDSDEQKQENINQRYKECLSCDLHVPFRSHHCPYCRRCIYILDHHCFFLGHCVGRRNQKFFLVFCFYAAIGCGLGVSHVFHVLTNYRDFYSRELIYYFLPFSIVNALTGRVYILETMYVGYLNFGFGAFLMTLFLFLIGMISVVRGLSSYEARKSSMAEHDQKPLTEKFEQVFGKFGFLHFIIPFLPFRNDPYCEPGYRRLLGPGYA